MVPPGTALCWCDGTEDAGSGGRRGDDEALPWHRVQYYLIFSSGPAHCNRTFDTFLLLVLFATLTGNTDRKMVTRDQTLGVIGVLSAIPTPAVPEAPSHESRGRK